MTGYQSEAFRHDCSTRGCYIAGLPNWGDLFDVFPRGIQPTDVDGLVEINGKFLVLEEKHFDADLSNGQRYAFERLAMLGPVTVFVFRPARPSGLHVKTITARTIATSTHLRWEHISRADFKERLRLWAAYADKRKAAA